MACEKCERFPVPTSNFCEIDASLERHGTLYRCRACGACIEFREGDRSVQFPTPEIVRRYYPRAFPER